MTPFRTESSPAHSLSTYPRESPCAVPAGRDRQAHTAPVPRRHPRQPDRAACTPCDDSFSFAARKESFDRCRHCSHRAWFGRSHQPNGGLRGTPFPEHSRLSAQIDPRSRPNPILYRMPLVALGLSWQHGRIEIQPNRPLAFGTVRLSAHGPACIGRRTWNEAANRTAVAMIQTRAAKR